jgi:hypothetical protein
MSVPQSRQQRERCQRRAGPEKVPTPAVRRTLPVCRSDACLPKEYFLTHCGRNSYDSNVVSSHPAGQLQRGAIESVPFLIALIVRLASRARRLRRDRESGRQGEGETQALLHLLVSPAPLFDFLE